METRLAIASRREVRDYRPEPISDDAVRRILDAGRISGSSRNTQPWRFVVVRTRNKLDALAGTVSRPGNLEGAPLAILLALPAGASALDGGRAAQSMMLWAWSEGIGSCPNGILDKPAAAAIAGLPPELEPLTILSFGYPARTRAVDRRTPEEWIAQANRLPLDELVTAWL